MMRWWRRHLIFKLLVRSWRVAKVPSGSSVLDRMSLLQLMVIVGMLGCVRKWHSIGHGPDISVSVVAMLLVYTRLTGGEGQSSSGMFLQHFVKVPSRQLAVVSCLQPSDHRSHGGYFDQHRPALRNGIDIIPFTQFSQTFGIVTRTDAF